MTPLDPDTPEPLPPACRPTADRLDRVLDGELDPTALGADPHPAACPACRGRVAAARLLLSVLAEPAAPVPVPAGTTDRILAAVREDRYTRIRRRSYAVSVGAVVAIAASVMLVAWLTQGPPQPIIPDGPFVIPPDVVKAKPEVAPEPRPAAPPLRIGDELAKAGIALRDTPKAITEPAAAAPEVLSMLTDALTRPLAPMNDADMEPARAALADLPDAARTGLEPVTGTAQKAFDRLLRDVGALGSKPKS